jgi:hypothetical protein
MIHFDAAQQYNDHMIDQVDDMTIVVKCNAMLNSGPGCSDHNSDQAEPLAHPVVGHTTYGGEEIDTNVGWENCYRPYYSPTSICHKDYANDKSKAGLGYDTDASLS